MPAAAAVPDLHRLAKLRAGKAHRDRPRQGAEDLDRVNPSWLCSDAKPVSSPGGEPDGAGGPPHFIDARGRDHGPLPPMGPHKTDVVLYSQYRRSRLDAIRNEGWLPGNGVPSRPTLRCAVAALGGVPTGPHKRDALPYSQ